jgi:hypothetical protein
MGVAAGGLIRQSIVRDPGRLWRTSETKTFNVQILNSVHFRHVTEKRPLSSPIDAKTYAELGCPFYAIHEEPSDISGEFLNLKSIGHVDGFLEPGIPQEIVHLPDEKSDSLKESGNDDVSLADDDTTHDHNGHRLSPTRHQSASEPFVGFWNPEGPVAEFRDVETMERLTRAMGALSF